MQYLCAAAVVFVVILSVSKLLEAMRTGAGRARIEDQLHAFIRSWLDGKIPNNDERFISTKQGLMQEWLDANTKRSQSDFEHHFTQLVDGHCDSFAIIDYLNKRRSAAPKSRRFVQATGQI